MSFYNNWIDTNLNFNSNSDTQVQNNAQNSRFSNVSRLPAHFVDVTNSLLEPTAQEFHPMNQTGSANGAIKKTFRSGQSYSKNPRKNRNYRHGSGRTFSSFRPDQFHSIEKTTEQDDTGNLASYMPTEEPYSDLDSRSSYSSKKVPRDRRRQYNLASNNSDRSNHHQSNKQHENTSTKLGYEDLNFDNRFGSYENSSRNDKQNKYERSDSSYDRTESNVGNKYNRINESLGRSRTYMDRKYSSTFGKPRTDQVENRNHTHKWQRKDNQTSGFKSGFKTYYGRNSASAEEKNQRISRASNSVKHSSKYGKKVDAASQRERLVEMLQHRILECLVCCEKIRNSDKVWSCSQCFHILHLHCVAAWATSSKIENGWRCPACQNVCTEIPKQYKCYCGKTTDPKYDPTLIPHGCGDMCLKQGRTCEHRCPILCHPGPCPDCDVMVAKFCGCGSTRPVVKCGTDIEIVCGSVCSKTLDCGIHRCTAPCHPGSCKPCSEVIRQECFCGKQGRKVVCSADVSGKTSYSCQDRCEKTLSCGHHRCEKICHEGACDVCPRDVDVVTTCPCGKTPLKTARRSCLDPIPCCDKICGKVLKCGQPSLPHTCREKCHEGDCPKCPLTTVVRCRCGHMDKEIPCQKLTTKADDARCEKKCTKKRTCGKHKCNQRCCIELDHFCPLPCNHQLSCGQHRCERTCHSGRCPPCMETSFDELYCECGSSVIYPPISCGTKPPFCNRPCSRRRPCGHDANHNCHTGPCPPCTILCKRWCHGRHQERSAIPCHQESFSCGLACGKPMPCGRHKCNRPCHDGGCPLPCKQPCNVERALCGHPCGRPCHEPPCPESSCKQSVAVTCPCGLQKGSKACIEVAEEYRNLEMAKIKEKIGSLAKDQAVDISDIGKTKKPTVLKILDCTEECRVLERNRRLAIGLQIRNPDLSQKLTPKYTDFMKQWAKKDPHFCQKVHEKLTELVRLAKQSKQKSRSYSFESMNRDKRHFVHEYCEHFGIESAAYDAEPNRNIVATATKDKSWLPSMSLLEIIQRENGQRKVPGPSVLGKTPITKSETVCLRIPSQNPKAHQSEFIDYFDPPA